MSFDLGQKINKILKVSIKSLLFLTALTPLIISRSTAFPYIFGKIVFFRGIVEIVLILSLIYFFGNYKKVSENIRSLFKDFFKNPLFIFTVLFIISLAISTIFAADSYRSFWGTIDRGEGLFGMLHYFVIFLLSLLVFTKKDWLNFFKIYLVGGLILVFYAFLQYFKIYNFPLALNFIDPRPGSFVGNSAFLAAHLIFIIIFAAIVYFSNKEKQPKTNLVVHKFWHYFSLLMVVLSLATIFVTATRGAILGLGVGFIFLLFYFSLKREGRLRQLSIGLLVFMVIFGGFFWTTRHEPLWQKIPGLNRLADTALTSISDPSTQTRIITWNLSWKAFLEKPLVGWGPDNYLVAYEKYYDPNYSLYGETWLDRAHNKIFDLLVMEGGLGLLVYLGVFAGAFYLLFRKKGDDIPPEQNFIRLFVAAGLIAYFVQNLFLFDQINSDLTFFTLLGFIIFLTSKPKAPELISNPQVGGEKEAFSFPAKKPMVILIPFIAVAIGFLGYTVYADNYIPFVQSQAFQKSAIFGNNVDYSVKELKKAMYPYNFAQYNIRSAGVDENYMDLLFYNASYMGDSKYLPIADLLIQGMDELYKKEPYDVRIATREVEMLNAKAKYISEKDAAPLYVVAEQLMRDAVKRAPNRQEVYYHLAFNLAGQKRYDESIAAAEFAVSLNPKVARAHYHLALMCMLANKNDEALKELDVVQKLSPNLEGLLSGDLNTVILFYSNLGNMDKVSELVIKGIEGKISNHEFPRQYYEKSFSYFAAKKDLPHFLEVANYLEKFDDLKDDMATFIDLAKSGDWDVQYVYNGKGTIDKIAGLIIKSLDDNITTHRFSRIHYFNPNIPIGQTILGYFIHNEDAAHTLQIAGYLANFPDLKDNMEVIIDLVKKGNWQIIHNALGF